MRCLVSPADFTATGEIDLPEGCIRCELTVSRDGVVARDDTRKLLEWSAHEISDVLRDDYDLLVTNTFDERQFNLRRFARRTDELEVALRRVRANALCALMAPPGVSVRNVFEATGDNPGLLYRHDDGLRWVPHGGDCWARLYSEIGDVRFDANEYALVITGPFGTTRLRGLRRLSRELASETGRHIRQAREQFADALEAAGLPWSEEAKLGVLHSHVPFEATEARLDQLAEATLICDARRDYWELLRAEEAIERLALSLVGDTVRVVALGRARDGEFYEPLSEPDHACFVFECVDDVVQAWTEVGFRREPVFSPLERDPAAALARVLTSLRSAREGLLRRIIHDSPTHWRERLF